LKNSYGKFFAMILTSMFVMYVIKYFNTYELSHVYWSDTRFFMLLVMGGAMAIVMLAFMLGMYQNKKKNTLIFGGGMLLAILGVYLTRSQVTVGDDKWMKAMIPHHSIAILTSERAGIKDIRVRKLADDIIKAQRKEIKEMAWLIDDIQKNGVVSSESELSGREMPSFEGKLNPEASRFISSEHE
jgi:FlaA1/EpsC-like NDP-sugar epimerase